MAVTDDQLEELVSLAIALGTEHYEAAVYGEQPEALIRVPWQILEAIFEQGRDAGLRTEDEFDEPLTVEDLPAVEDRRHLIACYLLRRSVEPVAELEIDLDKHEGVGLGQAGEGRWPVVRLGDRVRHFGQRYNYSEGTATVIGFADTIGGQSYAGVRGQVFVVPDREDDSYASNFRFDGDRAVLVSFESFAHWERERRALQGSRA